MSVFPEKDIFTLQELADKWSQDFYIITVSDILNYGAKELLPIYIPISSDRCRIYKLTSDAQSERINNYSNTAYTVDPTVKEYVDKLTVYRKDCESDVLGLMSLPDLQYLSQSNGESIYLKYLLTEKSSKSSNEVLYVLNDYSMYEARNVYLEFKYLCVKLEDKRKFEEEYLKEITAEQEAGKASNNELGKRLSEIGKKGGRSPKRDSNFQLFINHLAQSGKKQRYFVKELEDEYCYQSMPKADDVLYETGLGDICNDLFLLDGKIHYTSFNKKLKPIALGTLKNFFARAKKEVKNKVQDKSK